MKNQSNGWAGISSAAGGLCVADASKYALFNFVPLEQISVGEVFLLFEEVCCKT